MNENDKIYTSENETVTEYKSYGAGAQSTAQPTATESQPITAQEQPVTAEPQTAQTVAPQQPTAPQQGNYTAPINPYNNPYYGQQRPIQGGYHPYGVPQQNPPYQGMPQQGAPVQYGRPQYAPPQGQFVPPTAPPSGAPQYTSAGQPNSGGKAPNIPPQYGYQPTYNQPATGNFTPMSGGAQFTPAQPPIYNHNQPVYSRPTVEPKPVKQPDPERAQRKSRIKQLANASTVPLLIYQIGGALLATLLSAFITAFYGEVRGAQILSDPDFLYLLNGVLSILFMSLPMLITSAWTKQPLSQTVAFRRFKPSTGIAIIMLGFGAIAVAQYGGSMVTYYFSLIFGEPISNPVSDFGTGPWSILISLLCVAVIPAFMEEFAFRGVLLGSARKYMSDGCSIMLNAILFSLLHGNLFQIPFTFALGLYLSYATVYTGSLWPAIIIHGVNNALAVLMTYAQNAATGDLMLTILSGAYYLVMLLVGLCGLIFLIKTTGEQPTFHLSKQRSEQTKENFGWFISAPWMIVFTVFMVLNVIVTQVAG